MIDKEPQDLTISDEKMNYYKQLVKGVILYLLDDEDIKKGFSKFLADVSRNMRGEMLRDELKEYKQLGGNVINIDFEKSNKGA